ncbi:dfrA [Pontibacillus halophilus JSM 076056 = DSM 19796]|uniref:DfrA n=1 Tax=Pontibacillus halophilus JSM 076056 = DSM 19796 TaxID=1385510 RepID=A0A0A5GM37_9BACI|nr:RidA family protein [Pontibacillus halophilus]KGX93009.1 dfrA [Pontibacillus halophilus JSM 076056 = DSM 19796]
MIHPLSTTKAPAAIGPYSQATDVGSLVFISGQIPLDPETMTIVSNDVVEQTKQVMENLSAILQEANLTFQHVAKMTIYLDSMDDFQTVNEVYASYLSEPYPARAAIEISRLPKDAKVEIEAIAVKE